MLEPDGEGTRICLSIRDLTFRCRGTNRRLRVPSFGWAKMLGQLPAVVAGLAKGIHKIIMKAATKRSVLRWTHLVFTIPISDGFHGKPSEVEQYVVSRG